MSWSPRLSVYPLFWRYCHHRVDIVDVVENDNGVPMGSMAFFELSPL